MSKTKTTTTTRKATHQGACQICGATQKLPSGVLSLHGYTTRWGFFSGICSGSGHLPFEQSKDLIASQIAWAEAEAARLDAEAAELLAGKLNEDGTTWYGVYSNRTARREYELVTIHQKVSESGFDSYTYTGQYGADRERHQSIKAYEVGGGVPGKRSIDDVRREFNAKYAYRLQQKAVDLRQYAVWQRERIANWKPQELKPITK